MAKLLLCVSTSKSLLLWKHPLSTNVQEVDRHFREFPFRAFALISAHQIGNCEHWTMPKKQRQQKRDGKPPSAPEEKVVGEENRPAPELQDDLSHDDAHTEEEESGGDGEDERSKRAKSLRDFLKHAKGQHYRVIETRVALVCSFGVFAKLIFSDALVDHDEDSFITHAAITFAGCK